MLLQRNRATLEQKSPDVAAIVGLLVNASETFDQQPVHYGIDVKKRSRKNKKTLKNVKNVVNIKSV